MKIRRLRSIPALLVLAALIPANPAAASEAGDQGACVKRISEAIQGFTATYVAAVGRCEGGNLSLATKIDCADDRDTKDQVKAAADKLVTQFNKCTTSAFVQVCALSKVVPLDLYKALTTGDTSLMTTLAKLVNGLWVKPTPGHPRPVRPISKDAESCVRSINTQFSRVTSQIQQCVSKCEVSLTKSGGEVCIAPDTGDVMKEKTLDCVVRARQRLSETLAARCTPTALEEVGWPLGTATVDDLLAAFQPYLDKVTAQLDVQVYNSSCRYRIAINPVPPTAIVELNPSGTLKEIRCGDELDAAFFGDDDTVELQSDLNCQDAGKVNGIVISASNVSVNLGKSFRVSGPAKVADRTGTGILLKSGARGVSVERGLVQRFLTGVADQGAGTGNTFEQLSVRSNQGDGFRLSAEGFSINNVSVKSNGGYGIRLLGNGGEILGSSIELSGLDGLRIDGADTRVDGIQSGALKESGNSGYGFVVNGIGASIYQSTAEANAGGGFLVNNATIKFKANSATSNLGTGIRFTQGGSGLDSNRSELNGGFAFDIAPGNLDETGNRANGSTILFGPEGGTFN